VIDYRDWHVPLGRRFRALKLWWVLRSYGARGIRHHIREHVRLAERLGRLVDEHPALERVAPSPSGWSASRTPTATTRRAPWRRRSTTDGSVYVTTSTIGSRSFIRVAVGATATTERDVERLWSILLDALAARGRDR
jgi:aromatic-L-amino-acid decarboxylase